MRDVCYCIDVQGNTTISTSTSNFGSSGRVDGPLLPKLLVLVDMVVFPCTSIQ